MYSTENVDIKRWRMAGSACKRTPPAIKKRSGAYDPQLNCALECLESV